MPLEQGDLTDALAARRALDMPCPCDRSVGAELLERRDAGAAIREHLRCLACARTFKRVWC